MTLINNSSALLREYQHEREILLDKITALLQHDQRIAASWLEGSLGRREEDELSDLDLWVVVKNEFISQLVNERRNYAAQIGDPILFVEAPQNAPLGGGYLAAGYAAPAGPHLVDWNWQPESLAFLPGQISLLFDRAGLPRHDRPGHIINQVVTEELLNKPDHFISFFWMMLLITAKHIARQSPRAEELLNITRAPFLQAIDFINAKSHSGDFSMPNFAGSGRAAEQLLFLRHLAEMMQKMMDKVSKLGYSLPNKVVPGAFRYLDMIDNLIQG